MGRISIFASVSVCLVLLVCAGSRAERLVDFVDPFIATGGDGFGVGSGFPGPSAPFGMIKPGPDTTAGGSAPGFYHCSGYYHRDKHIRGFSHTRMYGTGAADYGNIMLMPTYGDAAAMTTEENYRTKFSHEAETASPGYYAVTLEDTGIRVELTASEIAGRHRYTMPRDGEALLVVNAAHFVGEGTPVETEVTVDAAAREITGWFHYKGGLTGRSGGIKVYFAVETAFPFEGRGVWVDGKFDSAAVSGHGTTAGAAAGFAGKQGEIVELKVAVSFVSVEQARANLREGAPGWDFEAMRKQTEDEWERLLSRFRVEAPTEKIRRIFYTAVYHSLLMPTLFTEAGGAYTGFDKRTHNAEGFRYYSDFSMWDTFRTLHPLLAAFYPEYQRDMNISLVKMYEQGGWIPKWPAGTGYSNCMTGTPADSVIADSYLKGVTDFDVELAYRGLRDTAMNPTPPGSPYGGRDGIEDYIKIGWVPSDRHGDAASKTLEYAHFDFALSQLAAALGKTDDARMFLERSRNYRNVWDSEKGFFYSRRADGTFEGGFNDSVWIPAYTEGTAWQWLWFAPHDPAGLMELMGGREKFTARLDEFFGKSHKAPDTLNYDRWYWHGNEPDLHAAYLYLWAGRPDRAQEEVRWILSKKYSDKPAGLDGNDDAGTLSAWYIFSAMGFFPFPATTQYYIGSPILSRAELDMGGGRKFVMTTLNVTPANVYVQSASLNGIPLERPWIEHSELAAGGELVFEMGAAPSQWGKMEAGN